MVVLDIFFLIVSVLLIVLTLLQSGKSDGASGAITGGNLNVFYSNKRKRSRNNFSSYNNDIRDFIFS